MCSLHRVGQRMKAQAPRLEFDILTCEGMMERLGSLEDRPQSDLAIYEVGIGRRLRTKLLVLLWLQL